MVYGHAKRRQMARSLLPSTARREAARDLDRIRRGARRSIRQELRRLTGGPRPICDRWDDASFDAVAWPQRAIKDAVRERRGFDKIGSFQRWAVATTAATHPEERLQIFRTMLPPGLIGWHALSHLENLEHFGGRLPAQGQMGSRPTMAVEPQTVFE